MENLLQIVLSTEIIDLFASRSLLLVRLPVLRELDRLDSLGGMRHISFRGVVDELASGTVGTVAADVFLAGLGFVEEGDVCLDHHVVPSVGERALQV